jgi:uncharacterized protein (DUF302 family)
MIKGTAIALVLGAVLAASVVRAEEAVGYREHTKNGTFEDVRDDLRDAIINRGFVVDHSGDLHAMLDRTAKAVADVVRSDAKSPYKNAEYLQFCPLKLTHEAVRASPYAIANCPTAIFVFETNSEPGKIHVGYRLPPATPSSELRKVNEKLIALLDSLAKEATEK